MYFKKKKLNKMRNNLHRHNTIDLTEAQRSAAKQSKAKQKIKIQFEAE